MRRRNSWTLFLFVVSFCFVLVGVEPFHAQDSAPPQSAPTTSDDSGTFVFKTDVEEVVVHATVVDDKNHLVTKLDQSAFTVLENNHEQKIISFHHEDIPVAIGNAEAALRLLGWQPKIAWQTTLGDVIEDWRVRVKSENVSC